MVAGLLFFFYSFGITPIYVKFSPVTMYSLSGLRDVKAMASLVGTILRDTISFLRIVGDGANSALGFFCTTNISSRMSFMMRFCVMTPSSFLFWSTTGSQFLPVVMRRSVTLAILCILYSTGRSFVAASFVFFSLFSIALRRFSKKLISVWDTDANSVLSE